MSLTYSDSNVTGGAASSSCAISVPTHSSGDVAIAGLYTEDALSSTPSGWTLIDSVNQATDGFTLYTFYRILGASEPASYTWTFTGSTWCYGGMAVYSGHSGSGDPVDATSSVTWASTGANQTLPAVTVANDSTTILAVCVGYFDSPESVSGAAGTNQRVKSGGFLLEDGVVTTAGSSGTSSVTPFGTDSGAAFHIALLDSSGASGQTVTLNHLSSGTTFFNMGVTPGAASMVHNHLGPTSQLHEMSVSPGASDIVLNEIPAGSTVHNAAIAPGAASMVHNLLGPGTALHQMSVSQGQNIVLAAVPWSVDTTLYSAASDGYIYSGDDTYSNARAGTGTALTATTGATTLAVGQFLSGVSPTSRVFISYLNFDVSAIPSGSSIDAATLSLYLSVDVSTTDFTVEARQHDWGDTLTTADFVAGASLSGKTLLASIDTSGWGATGSYKALTSEAALLTAIEDAIAGDGVLRILLCSSRTTNGDAPTTREDVFFYSADQTGTAQDPKVDISYTIGSQVFETTITPVLGITHNLLAAGSALYQMAVSPGAASVVHNLLAAGTTLYQMAVSPGATSITHDLLGPTSSLYQMTVNQGQGIFHNLLGPDTALYQMGITPGSVSVVHNHIGAGTALYQMGVTPGAVAIVHNLLAAGSEVFQMALSPGAATITLDHLDAGSNVYALTIFREQFITLNHIDPETELFLMIAGDFATVLVDARLVDMDTGYRLVDTDTGYTLVEVDETRYVLKKVN